MTVGDVSLIVTYFSKIANTLKLHNVVDFFSDAFYGDNDEFGVFLDIIAS